MGKTGWETCFVETEEE